MMNIYCDFNNTCESIRIINHRHPWYEHDVFCLQMRLDMHMDTQTPCNTSESVIRSRRLM